METSEEVVRLVWTIIYTCIEMTGALVILGLILVSLLIPPFRDILGWPLCVILMVLGVALFFHLIIRLLELTSRWL